MKYVESRLKAIEQRTQHLRNDIEDAYFTLDDLNGRKGIFVYKGKIYDNCGDIPYPETPRETNGGEIFELPVLLTPEKARRMLNPEDYTKVFGYLEK